MWGGGKATAYSTRISTAEVGIVAEMAGTKVVCNGCNVTTPPNVRYFAVSSFQIASHALMKPFRCRSMSFEGGASGVISRCSCSGSVHVGGGSVGFVVLDGKPCAIGSTPANA